MRFIIKPNWKNSILEITRYQKADNSAAARNLRWYRYEEFEVEIADTANLETVKQLHNINLDDEQTFKHYESLFCQGCDELHYEEWETYGCSDSEREKIEEDCDISELEEFEQKGNTRIVIQSDCSFVAISDE